MKILFCTDGSSISYNALENFALWVKDKKVDADIISAIDLSILPGEFSVEEEHFMNSCANVASGILDNAQEDVEKLGLICDEKIKVCGPAVDSILNQIEKAKYDMVLMGSHGRKGIQKWLGSVSQDVIASVKLTSYISKYKNRAQKILFPLDGSQQSFDGAEYILKTFNLENKDICACIVNEEPDILFFEGNMDKNWKEEIERNQQLYASSVINRFGEILKKYNFSLTESAILKGNISQKIIEYVSKNKVDLVCMTGRNLTKVQKFILGSTSKRVLANTQADTVIVNVNYETNS